MDLKKKIFGAVIPALLVSLCACGTPESAESSEMASMQVDSAILSILEARVERGSEKDTVAQSSEIITEGETATGQNTITEQNIAAQTNSNDPSDENTQTIKSYYDAYTAENTAYDGLILTLYRFNRGWYEETQAVASGDWPIWTYGVTHYPYARDDNGLYMLSLPLIADTDPGNTSCVSSYKAAQEDTLNSLKDYASAKGLTLNPDLDEDYSTFVSQLWKNTENMPSPAAEAAPTDQLLEKLNSASVTGSVSQAARDAFYHYLSSHSALFEQVSQWNWSLAEDTKSKYITGWISLDFGGTFSAEGGYHGISLYYRPDTGAVLTFEEMDAYVSSMDAEIVNAPAISAKLSAAFSSLGNYHQDAFDTMLTFLGTSDGSWMWEKCRDWSWVCSYDSSTDRYALNCTGPLETDGTQGVQSLVVQGSQIVGYPSGYITASQDPNSAATPSDTTPAEEVSPEQ